MFNFSKKTESFVKHFAAISFILFSFFCDVNSQTKSNSEERLFLLSTSEPKSRSLIFNEEDQIKAKVGAYKRMYRKGEILKLSLVILNMSNQSIFFLKPNEQSINIEVLDENDKNIGFFPFEIYQIGYSSSMFSLISSKNIISGSTDILIGCKDSSQYMDRKINVLQETELNEVDKRGKRLFEENLYLSWGTGCADIKGSGTYKIRASISNRKTVVISNTKMKTFVGDIKPEPYLFEVEF